MLKRVTGRQVTRPLGWTRLCLPLYIFTCCSSIHKDRLSLFVWSCCPLCLSVHTTAAAAVAHSGSSRYHAAAGKRAMRRQHHDQKGHGIATCRTGGGCAPETVRAAPQQPATALHRRDAARGDGMPKTGARYGYTRGLCSRPRTADTVNSLRGHRELAPRTP